MRAALAIALSLIAAPALALDLGTVGPTYEIGEPHLIEFLKAKLREMERRGDIQRMQEEAKARAVETINHPKPIPGISAAQTARTFYYDPTYTLDHNIFDDKGALMFAAGTKKNPLEVVSMSKHLLFFDARDARQVQRARALIDTYGGKVKPILVGGSYMDLMKRWRTPVFFDQTGALVRKLGIARVPALVSQEGMRLRVDELVVQ